ncbi:MAG: sugar ABC transporter permease [Armatimonadetes bacterium]|nr:sugar ABC transporter permease [Armatimonadota bacterium]
MVAPFVLFNLVFLIFPLGFCIYLSLTDWTMYKPTWQFVGFRNYAELLFSDEVFVKALGNTMYYVVFTVAGVVLLGAAMAVLLNQRLRGIGLFRTVFYFPVVVDWVIVSTVWLFLLEPSIGLINQVLRANALPAQPFFNSRSQAMPLMIGMSIWKGVAYYAIIFLAGLQDVPQVLLEQAQIDGANRWQAFRHVTVPWMAPVTLLVIVLASINALRVFSPMYVITGGGPVNATMTVMLLLYNQSFRYLEMGYGSAIAVVFSALVLVLVLIQRRILSSPENA